METRTSIPRKEIYLRDYLAVLERYKWLIVVVVIIIMSPTVLYLRWQVPVYKATAIIMLEPKNSGGLSSSLSDFLPNVRSRADNVSTEIAIIKGRTIAERVVRELGLHLRERKIKQSLIDKILSSVRLGPRLDKLEKNELEKDPERNLRRTVSEFQRRLEVKQEDSTNLVSVKVICDSPEDARDIANKVIDEYIQWSDILNQSTWNGLISQMEEKLNQVKADMERSRYLLHEYEAEQGITTAFGPLLIGDGTQTGAAGTRYMVPETSQAVAGMMASIIEMEVQLQTMQKTHSAAAPVLISLKNQISASKNKLKEEEEKAINKYDKQFGLTKLASEVVFSQQLYSTLMTRQEVLKAQYLMQNNSPKIVERALLPFASNKSNKIRTLILGGFLGLFLGIGFAFSLEYLDSTIRTPDDVEQHLNLQVLGAVPRVKEAKRNKTPSLVLQGNQRTAPAEAYRSIRTKLLFSTFAAAAAASSSEGAGQGSLKKASTPPKTIVITSVGPGEGKSFTTVNLGMVLAQSGQRVLLVDADLRRPMLHRVFDLNGGAGLSAVLAGELSLNEAILETPVANLSVLTTGAVPKNPSEVLGSAEMVDIINSIREQYDMVLLDSAPILGMSDTVVLASEVDAVTIVIRIGTATRKSLKFALTQLASVDARVFGVVLNDVDFRRDKYYDYYYPYENNEERYSKKRKRRRHSGGQEVTDESQDQSATGQ